MSKPKEILQLEVKYGLTFKKLKRITNDGSFHGSSYNTDRNNEVITLIIPNSRIKDLNFIKKFSKLKHLCLDRNPIDDISILKNLKNLTTLSLGETGVLDINFLKSLPNVASLSLRDNQLKDCSILENLLCLKVLDLSRNRIQDFSFLPKLVNLEKLTIWSNHLVDTDHFQNLGKLKKLSLWDNQIQNIEFIEKLKNITQLDLGKNPIKDFTPISKLNKLVDLEIDNCEINDLQFLSGLTNLKELNLNLNSLEDLTPLSSLEGLQTLSIMQNQLHNLWPLADLERLKCIRMEFNSINDLRPLENIIRKHDLPIYLTEDSFENIGIFINRNFPTVPPQEVIVQGNATVLQYFDDAKKYGIRPLNECKIILLGDGELGKTSLMKKIVGLPFSEEETTHGINKKSWEGIKNDSGEDVRVNLWDFGGQHIQHSLHQFFLTENVTYILLLNPRNDTNAMYWLEQINKLGKDSEILIVYNWKNIKDKESHSIKNFYELRKTYPNLKEPFLLSCKTGEGYEQFREQLVETILMQRELHVQYPLNWFNIKKELEENVTINKNYILYNEYNNICSSHSYNNEINKKNLLKQLHTIGSIVFFDKPILDDLQVLNPDWITTGAYSIITSEITLEKKGHLTYEDLLEIFKDEKHLFANEEIKLKYQAKDFLFIIALMTDYDLCVYNPFTENEYLIPCAFEGEKPEHFNEFKRNCIQYRFRFESSFEMLIMYRFMARNISKCIVKEGYWQSGIVIKDHHSNTYALVETNQYSKIIDFWISGENIREMWEVVRRDIKDINSKYSLVFEEEVLYEDEDEDITVFLSYDEMINSLKNGVRIIQYHPIHKIFNIDVLKVLENFEDSNKIMKDMKKNKISIDFKGDVNNSQMLFGGQNNTQNVYVNHYKGNAKIDELKILLENLEDLASENKEWQSNFENALKETYRLEDAKDIVDEKKSKSKLIRFFDKAKALKDMVAIGVLPAEIVTKGGKMLELAKDLFNYVL